MSSERSMEMAAPSGPHDPYVDLGVRPLINANGTLTAIGGSRMPSVVLDAMREAALSFVDMFELQEAVSARIARLTRNESALVCNGAANGIVLGVLAAMTGDDRVMLERLLRFGSSAMPRNEIVMHRMHRIPYDRVIQLTGARIVEVGNALETERPELEAAIGEHTAAVLFVAGGHLGPGALSLEETLAVAGDAGVPVIVDAAAQLPPVDNLWGFTRRGADIALFSGGKALHGPQATGLILGSAQMVRACEMHASPHQRLGRSSKVGKEEMIGLLTAVEWYLDRDHSAEEQRLEILTAEWVDHLDRLPSVTARRDFPGEAGRPLPRALVSWEKEERSSEDVRLALRTGEPPIDVAVAGERSIFLSAELIDQAEHRVVTERLTALFES
jgi:L-seryl-tRNA(Ser) seleniumtransferase